MNWIIVFKSLISKSTWWNEGNHHFGADRNCKLQNVTLVYCCYHSSHSGIPQPLYFQSSFVYWHLCYRHQSPPRATSVHSHLAGASRGTGITLGAADAASNPGNSAVRQASIKNKKTASHLCLLESQKSIYKTQSKLIWPFDYNWKLGIAKRKQRQHRTQPKHIRNS